MSATARMQQKTWAIRPAGENCDAFAAELGMTPIVARILRNRGITNADLAASFLKPKLTDLIPPEKMPNIGQAVERVLHAVKTKEKITIYGDYDVDGISATAIMWQFLTLLEADVDYYIPHRVDEGYGLNDEAITSIAKAGTKLLITVDCGITAIAAVEFAKQLGMDVIITDHHRPGSQLPAAFAIVHPALDPDYPNQCPCGAMVAFKLAWAIANEIDGSGKLRPQLRQFMINATSLAAMGTVADVVDLLGENRIVTSFGLKTLPQCTISGIGALIETAGLTGQGLDSFHIGFRLAPMLNAAGRMGHARLAVELLTSDSAMRSVQIAEYLKEQNTQRRKCEQQIFKHACEIILERGLNHPDNKSIVLSDESWHSGVIGIVASRLVEKFFRPTIMLSVTNGTAQGSGRSIAGFDLLAAIDACSSHLKHFGGHKMAAGVTIETPRIEQFAADIEKYARLNIRDDQICSKLDIEALVPLSTFNSKIVTQLSTLAPFGQGNPEPIFATHGVRLASNPKKCGAKGDHLQLSVTDGTVSFRCIGFNMGKFEKKLLEKDSFSIAYKPNSDSYNGSSYLQLVLEDISFD